MSKRIEREGYLVDHSLDEFVKNELLVGVEFPVEKFWRDLANLFAKFTPRNHALLNTRKKLQLEIDLWHKERKGRNYSLTEYKNFLKSIGYLAAEGQSFKISTTKVDPEISTIAGPQLVVPVTNGRFALNAANARWGSLYDALYGTDVISQELGVSDKGKYNPTRGLAVINYASKVLDKALPLKSFSHSEVDSYSIIDGELKVGENGLVHSEQFVGYVGDVQNPSAILFKNNGLHIEIQIDREHPVGKANRSGVKDVLLEAAVTTIQDMEDSVATVDGEDKVQAYRNLLGLFKGDLSETFSKDGSTIHRTLNPDRSYNAPGGEKLILPGRSLLLVRNVGLLMTNPAILDKDGNEVHEGILDAMVTGLIGIHDLRKVGDLANSRAGSIYVVKPKLHGPEEVAFTCDLFAHIESVIGIPSNTIKIGIMDEERRTTLNLMECIREAKERVVFINTGFLDRTGDEIHTSMEAGAFLPKGDIKLAPWIEAYEDWNVDIGLEVGMRGKAQIGKGMWAMPDEMAQMIESKIHHPMSGASTAWVPSPTAAVLHAIHYHQVDVAECQKELEKRPRASIDKILEVPLLGGRNLGDEEVMAELQNNCQGILGYVVRWVDNGIGCSKVPDINNIGLMEDRATLRISSQLIANWIYHGVCSKEQVLKTMRKMAKVVDEQNRDDPGYKDMSQDYEGSLSFNAACDLIFLGREEPSGYTEPILHGARNKAKMVD